MDLTSEEIFYLEGLINQQLEDCKWTLTSKEFTFRYNLKSKIKNELKKEKATADNSDFKTASPKLKHS